MWAEFEHKYPASAQGCKSVAFSLTFRAEDRTLTDADIEPAMDSVLRALEAGHGAVRR